MGHPLSVWWGAGSGALQQKLPFTSVAREPCRSFEFSAGFLQPAKLLEEVGAHAGQQVIVLKRRF